MSRTEPTPGGGWVAVTLPSGQRAKVRTVDHPTRGRLVIVKPLTGKR